MMVRILFTCHGGSCCSCAMCFSCHGSSCCSCVMVFFMPRRFMLFMCQVVFPCQGGSCCSCAMVFFTSHGGSCFVYMSWWFMLFMCHLFLHVMVVHVVHVSWCFFMSWQFMFMCQAGLFM